MCISLGPNSLSVTVIVGPCALLEPPQAASSVIQRNARTSSPNHESHGWIFLLLRGYLFCLHAIIIGLYSFALWFYLASIIALKRGESKRLCLLARACQK